MRLNEYECISVNKLARFYVSGFGFSKRFAFQKARRYRHFIKLPA